MNQTLLTTARWALINRSACLDSQVKETMLSLLDKEIGYSAPDIGDVDIVGTPVAPLPSFSKGTKVALCVGHSRSGDSGAVATNGLSEHKFNKARAVAVKSLLENKGIEAHVIDYYQGGGYSSAMQWLANHLRKKEYTLAVEFHFNSASPSAKGFEYLFWHKSKVGILVAKEFQKNHLNYFPDAYDRGIEPLGDEAHERGVLFTSLTHCPAVILEPFFGSNKSEVDRYMSTGGQQKLEAFYADSIFKSVNILKNAA